MKVVMDDGTEAESGPGEAVIVPPGHNAWVVGNEPCVAIDFTGAKEYAESVAINLFFLHSYKFDSNMPPKLL